MTRLSALCSIPLSFLALVPACSQEKPAAPPAEDKGRPPAAPGGDPEKGDFTLEEATAGLGGTGALYARISTEKGDIVCELLSDIAPRTVASFVGLARGTRAWMDPKTSEWKKTPYFDGLAFHRVIPKFMIQGGDIVSRDYESGLIGTGGPGYELPNETKADVTFDRPGRLAMANSGPDTGGSQFFITEVPKKSLNDGYTIFGQCDAPEIVQEIARVPRGAADKPNSAVTMRVEIFRR